MAIPAYGIRIASRLRLVLDLQRDAAWKIFRQVFSPCDTPSIQAMQRKFLNCRAQFRTADEPARLSGPVAERLNGRFGRAFRLECAKSAEGVRANAR